MTPANKGIRLATGDYLCFLNAGDSFHEDDTLQQMVRSISGNELPDVLYGETELIGQGCHFIRMRRLAAPEVLLLANLQKQGAAGLPSGLLCQSFPCRIRPAIPYSADFDWCIRVKKAQTLHQYPSHPHRLSGRGNDHPEPASILRERFHHGAALRTDEYRSPSCLVRITGRDKEIAINFEDKYTLFPQDLYLGNLPLYPAPYSME